jgi:hypothetical protein
MRLLLRGLLLPLRRLLLLLLLQPLLLLCMMRLHLQQQGQASGSVVVG